MKWRRANSDWPQSYHTDTIQSLTTTFSLIRPCLPTLSFMTYPADSRTRNKFTTSTNHNISRHLQLHTKNPFTIEYYFQMTQWNNIGKNSPPSRRASEGLRVACFEPSSLSVDVISYGGMWQQFQETFGWPHGRNGKLISTIDRDIPDPGPHCWRSRLCLFPTKYQLLSVRDETKAPDCPTILDVGLSDYCSRQLPSPRPVGYTRKCSFSSESRLHVGASNQLSEQWALLLWTMHRKLLTYLSGFTSTTALNTIDTLLVIPVPDMTYNVFGGTLNLTQSIITCHTVQWSWSLLRWKVLLIYRIYSRLFWLEPCYWLYSRRYTIQNGTIGQYLTCTKNWWTACSLVCCKISKIKIYDNMFFCKFL